MNNNGSNSGGRNTYMVDQVNGGMEGISNNIMMMNHNLNFNHQMQASMEGVNSHMCAMGGMTSPTVAGQGMMGDQGPMPPGMMRASAPPMLGSEWNSSGLSQPPVREHHILQDNQMKSSESKPTVFSPAEFLKQWIQLYRPFQKDCLVYGTLYIALDGKEDEAYCINEKIFKDDSEALNILSSSYQYHITNKDAEINSKIAKLGQDTPPTPHKNDPGSKENDSDTETDQDMESSSDEALTLTTISDKQQKKNTTAVAKEPLEETDDVKDKLSAYKEEESQFMCEVCGESFLDRRSLLRHKRVHLQPVVENPKCDICGRSYARSRDLLNHKCGPQPREKTFSCRFCGIAFIQLRSLKRHVLTHTDEAAFKCEKCGKTFTTPTVFKQHMRFHTGEAPFECEVCGRGCTSKKSLKDHQQLHFDKKTFVCDKCGRSYLWPSKLLEHMKTHKETISEAPSQAYQPTMIPEKKPSTDHQYANKDEKAKIELAIDQCSYCEPKDHTLSGIFEELNVILPNNSYKYIMCKADPQFVIDSDFTAQFCINLKSKEEIQAWLDEFSNLTNTTFCIFKTFKTVGSKVLFRQDLYCQQGCPVFKKGRINNSRKYNVKKTNCDVKIDITLNSFHEADKNPHKSTHPTKVILKWGHNHDVEENQLCPQYKRNVRRNTNDIKPNVYLDVR